MKRKINFGVRNGGWVNWKKYLIPHNIMPKFHEYYAWFYWWLGFYICRGRKCDVCGHPVENTGGVTQYDANGDPWAVFCRECDTKFSVKHPVEYGMEKCPYLDEELMVKIREAHDGEDWGACYDFDRLGTIACALCKANPAMSATGKENLERGIANMMK